jgi:NAD(P)-dependent dehydrogenase (short-subunit alcohol dehydrogenase family)
MSLRPFAGLVWRPGRGIRPLSGNDKQILITGATNGIRLAAAEALAALGANLAIVGRSKTRTRIASARIRVAAGKGATVGNLSPTFRRRHRCADWPLRCWPAITNLDVLAAELALDLGAAVAVYSVAVFLLMLVWAWPR